MSTNAPRTGARRLCLLPLGVLAVIGSLAFPAASQEQPTADHSATQNHILGISTCPPWNPQSPEVCKHSLEEVITALAPRIGAGPENTHVLVNEGASALALKLKATELANKLGPHDRLIIYANLPLGRAEQPDTKDVFEYVLELWSDKAPETAGKAIGEGTWISAPAFAAMIHAIRAGEVILILDTNNSYAVNLDLLDEHSVDMENRPEALVTSSGPEQMANYSADRTISLFAKHLATALTEGEGTLLDVMTLAASGTRQAAIPICATLMEHQEETEDQPADCTQVPEIHDPDGLLGHTMLTPLSDS